MKRHSKRVNRRPTLLRIGQHSWIALIIAAAASCTVLTGCPAPAGGALKTSVPQFDPPAGAYSGDQLVVLTDATKGASIHYTLDGSSPTAASQTYAHPLSVAGDGSKVKIRAVATADGMGDSDVVSASYSIDYSLGGPPPAAVGLASVGPVLSFARVGQTNGAPTYPDPLTVSLTNPAKGDTTVTITSSDSGSLSVSDVVVPDGMTSAVVPVTAITQAADVTVTATLGAMSKSTHVRVLAPGESPSTVIIDPATTFVPLGGSVQLTVRLDIPAPTGGTTINLSVSPASAGTAPATVTVASDQLAASFDYTAANTEGSASVTAALGASSSSSTVTATSSAGHLVINEVDYDQPGTDTAEFIEIYNPTGAQSLSNLSVVLVNGADEQIYDTIDLSSLGTLASGGYLVIAGPNVTVSAPAVKLDPGWTSNAIQNGSPDGIAIVDTAAGIVIDALSYEGATNAIMPWSGSVVSLVEGTETSVADSTASSGSLCRSPNGTDTDDASQDWQFCPTPTPGAANP